ncbi:MAG: pirin family protein [Legionella sp.]|nr:pirin family protein [Legionella sp.]
MRTITKVIQATSISSSQSPMKLLRIIGTVDVDGHGTDHALAQVDPFIFLDDALIEGEISSSIQKHPHTGLTAVTYLLEGTVHAWDNIHGATPDLNRAGGLYLVDSGRGLVHGEAPVEGLRRVRLLQMWFNPGLDMHPMPQASYQLFQPNDLPIYQNDHVWAKIIIGKAFGFTSPIVSRWPIQYLHCKLNPHQTYTMKIPNESWQGFIYIISGQGKFGTNKIIGHPKHCLVLGSESLEEIELENTEDHPLEFIFATGKPHQKPFIKLLGFGGAIITDTVANARKLMQAYEKDPVHFGQRP